MIHYGKKEEWVYYTRAFASIIRSVIYFDYAGDILDANLDPDSPYVIDS